MAKRKSKSQPTWTDVKAKLADFDRTALLGLIQSLYAAYKDNHRSPLQPYSIALAGALGSGLAWLAIVS